MKKMNTSPISGMQEFLPAHQAIFNQIKSQIAEVYRLHGFQQIETPTIDRAEVLFAKAGGDTEKQIYKVIKTAETEDAADQALRFDHTVPLARYIVEHESSLSFPFRVTQIGRNFRGERAQKGRFREFYQCDVDIIGRNTLPIYYDAQVIACLYDALKTFVKPKVRIRVNNRKFLSGVISLLGLNQYSADIYSIIDHSEKVPAEKTRSALEDLGISAENVVKITTLLETSGKLTELDLSFLGLDLSDAENGKSNAQLDAGLLELKQTMADLDALGLGDAAVVDFKIVRGLDYYTGTVFEADLPDYPQVGSIGGGGRYDNLASNYTDQSFPGVGASIGLSRLFYILTENNLIDEAASLPVDIAIITVGESDDLRRAAYDVAAKCRAKGQTVDVILTDKKLGDKLSHAAKIAAAAIIIGDEELSTGIYQTKNFLDGSKGTIEFPD